MTGRAEPGWSWIELVRARPQQLDQRRRWPKRVGDHVSVGEREGGMELASHLDEQDRRARRLR